MKKQCVTKPNLITLQISFQIAVLPVNRNIISVKKS